MRPEYAVYASEHNSEYLLRPVDRPLTVTEQKFFVDTGVRLSAGHWLISNITRLFPECMSGEDEYVVSDDIRKVLVSRDINEIPDLANLICNHLEEYRKLRSALLADLMKALGTLRDSQEVKDEVNNLLPRLHYSFQEVCVSIAAARLNQSSQVLEKANTIKEQVSRSREALKEYSQREGIAIGDYWRKCDFELQKEIEDAHDALYEILEKTGEEFAFTPHHVSDYFIRNAKRCMYCDESLESHTKIVQSDRKSILVERVDRKSILVARDLWPDEKRVLVFTCHSCCVDWELPYHE